MILTCYRCKKDYGEKGPFEDRRVSHGLCPPCVPLEWARIEAELKTLAKKAGAHIETEGGLTPPLPGEMR